MPTTSDNDSWSGDSDAAHVDVDISTHLVELGTPTSRLANATARARVFQYLDGDHQAALALLRDESRALTQQGLRDPDVLNRLRVSQAVALGYAGYAATAHRALSSLVESAGFSASALEAVAPYAMLTAQRGDLTKARAVLNRSFPIALLRAKQSPTAPGEIVVASFFTDLVTGRVSAAARTQKRILASLAKDRTNLPAHDIALSRIGVGMILSAEGQFSDAIIEFEAAIERYGSRDPYGQRPYLLAQYALALAASGDREGAQSVTFEANEGVHGTSRVTARFIDVQILLARMWCEQDVRTSAIETARKSREDELSLMELRALHILAMTDGAMLDKSIVVRAKEIASSSSAPVASPLAAHIADLSRGVPRLVSESARVLARCGIHVPIRGMLTELTSRERDVAISASLGYSSKTIASRFGNSKRTIDAHLNRIYLKLGIEGRYDLPEALDDANPQYRTDPELPSSTRATDRGAHDE